MPCQLQRVRRRTYRAATGASVTMCFSNPSGLAKLATAEFEVNKPLPIVGDACITFTVKSGTQSLFTVVTSPDPDDSYQVSEDCGGGATQKLDDEDFDPNDNSKIYRIVGI
jgi:hypothetical protein